MTVALLWLATLVVAVAGGAWVLSRQWRRRAGVKPTLERSQEHEAMVAALKEWLTEPALAKALAGEDERVRRSLQEMLVRLDALNETQVREFMALVLRSRIVRRAIASHVCATKKLPHGPVMAALLNWAGKDTDVRSA